MKNISVVIIAKNPESTLQMCLQSLIAFDDVVLYLNDTYDHSSQIASQFSNVKVIEGFFDGFGTTKNRAANFAKYDWILSLDSDEVLTTPLINELALLTLEENSVYQLLRCNFYKTTPIKNCWGNDAIIRLYNKTMSQFTLHHVHEKIEPQQLQVVQLNATFNHYPYQSISDFIIKADRYSTLFANDNAGKKYSSPSKAFFNGVFSFIKTYLFKRGFLDGYAGLLIAFSHMVTNFYKYLKLYELNQTLQQEAKQ